MVLSFSAGASRAPRRASRSPRALLKKSPDCCGVLEKASKPNPASCALMAGMATILAISALGRATIAGGRRAGPK
jgi:hypothetical protein